MKTIICSVIGCFLLFAGLGCERTEKAIETYKKVKEDAKQRAQEVKEGAQKAIEKKAQGVLGTQDKRLEEQQKQEKDE